MTAQKGEKDFKQNCTRVPDFCAQAPGKNFIFAMWPLGAAGGGWPEFRLAGVEAGPGEGRGSTEEAPGLRFGAWTGSRAGRRLRAARSRAVGGGLPAEEGGGAAAGGGRRAAVEEGGAAAGGGRMCEEDGGGTEGGEYLGGGRTKAAAAAATDDDG